MFLVIYTLRDGGAMAERCEAGPFEARSAAEQFAAGLPTMAAHASRQLVYVRIEDESEVLP